MTDRRDSCTNIVNTYPPVLCCPFSRVPPCVTPWTVACQAPLSVGFSSEEHWSGLPCPPPGDLPKLGIELAFLVSWTGPCVLYH